MGIFKLLHICQQTGPLGGLHDQNEPSRRIRETVLILQQTGKQLLCWGWGALGSYLSGHEQSRWTLVPKALLAFAWSHKQKEASPSTCHLDWESAGCLPSSTHPLSPLLSVFHPPSPSIQLAQGYLNLFKLLCIKCLLLFSQVTLNQDLKTMFWKSIIYFLCYHIPNFLNVTERCLWRLK